VRTSSFIREFGLWNFIPSSELSLFLLVSFIHGTSIVVSVVNLVRPTTVASSLIILSVHILLTTPWAPRTASRGTSATAESCIKGPLKWRKLHIIKQSQTVHQRNRWCKGIYLSACSGNIAKGERGNFVPKHVRHQLVRWNRTVNLTR